MATPNTKSGGKSPLETCLGISSYRFLVLLSMMKDRGEVVVESGKCHTHGIFMWREEGGVCGLLWESWRAFSTYGKCK